jgi:hypothetical protein
MKQTFQSRYVYRGLPGRNSMNRDYSGMLATRRWTSPDRRADDSFSVGDQRDR